MQHRHHQRPAAGVSLFGYSTEALDFVPDFVTGIANTHPVGIPDADRVFHTLTVGKTGQGKSTLLLTLMQQDLERGHGFALLDPHGDLAQTVLELVPSHRVKDVIYLNPSDLEFPTPLNVLADTWRWRGMVALTGVALALVVYPITEPGHDVINSDWPAFATGAKLALQNPTHLYDLDLQIQVQPKLTGGEVLITPGIRGILPFLAPAYVALIAVPFESLGIEVGGRLWVLFGLACFALGLWLASRPRPLSAILPGFASFPTALLMLNAQIDGFVALGLGAALALWSRPFLAGLALGLTLTKPQLVLPAGLALIIARKWQVLAGWAVAGIVLWASFAIFDPLWVSHWLGPIGATVAPVSREVDLPHVGVFLPQALQPYAVALISLATGIVVVGLAWRRRHETAVAASIVVAGGVLAAPHALPADLALISLALVMWGRASALDWVVLSVGAAVVAFAPIPVPLVAGVLVIGWVLVRQSLVPAPRTQPRPAPASSG